MLHIIKGHAPREWADAVRELRATPDATVNYEELHDKRAKEALLDALLREQGHVCAYCMRRIRRDGDGRIKGSLAHVEHYLPQRPTQALRDSMPVGGEYDADERSLDYRNMLAVCSGGESGSHGSARCCDKARSTMKMLTVDPRDSRSVGLVSYKRDGTIFSEEGEVDADLNDQLGLNLKAYSFKDNRKRAIDRVDQWVSGLRGGHDARKSACVKRKQKHMSDREAYEDIEPYLGVVLWRLEYWISRNS